MKALAVVLLLFFFFSASPAVALGRSEAPNVEGGADAPPELPVVWDELRGLKELVLSMKAEEVERRLILRSVESRLRDGEEAAERQRRSLDGLEETARRRREELRSRDEKTEADRKLLMELNSDLRRRVEELEEQNKALAAELPFLQTRLRASERTVEQLRRKSAVQAAGLCSAERLLDELRGQISASNGSSPAEGQLLVRLEELSAETEDLQSRLRSMERNQGSTAAREQLLLDQVRNDLNSSQLHLDQLRSLSADQTGRLLSVESRLGDAERHLDELRTETSGQFAVIESRLTGVSNATAEMLGRLRVGEKQVEDLRTESTELEVRLRVGEKQLEHLRTESTGHSVQLVSLESRLSDSRSNATGLEVRLNVCEKQLEQLETQHTGHSVQLSSLESRLTGNTELVSRLTANEKQLEHLRTENTALEARLRSTEKHLEQLETHVAVLEAELSAATLGLNVTDERVQHLRTQNTVLQVRLTAAESAVTELRAKSEELQARLRVGEKQVEDLRTGSTAFSFRLNATDDRLQQIARSSSDELKVAFSAGLTDSGSVGPFDEETTLIFSKTISNVGGAYDQTAGVFTAPVEGLYFFSFTAADYVKGYMGLYLYRNDRPIVFSLDLNDHGGYASASSSVALRLGAGDRVRLGLPASYRLYDDSRTFSVFSGFLLFAL